MLGAFMSAILAGQITGSPPDFLVDPSPQTITPDGLTTWSKIATRTDTQPIAELPSSGAGVVGRAFMPFLYDRVHVIPAEVDVGLVAGGTVTRAAEVWNAWRASQTHSGTSVAGTGGGLSLAAPAAPPTTYGPLESRVHTIVAGPDGPPIVDAFFTFAFSADAPVLHVVGRRIIVLPHMPDWEAGVLERWGWTTDVLTAHDGSEQRIRLRSLPRLASEYAVIAGGDDAARLDVLLDGAQARTFTLPRWRDLSRLTAAAAPGAVSVACDTTGRDFAIGRLAVLIQDGTVYEAFTITALSAGSLSIDPPLVRTWPAGAAIVPARLGRVNAAQAVRYVAEGTVRATITAETIDGVELAPVEWSPTYAGVGVFVRRPHRGEDEQHDHRRRVRELDPAPNVATWWDDPAARGFAQHRHVHLGKTRAESLALCAWIAAREGRRVSYWLPVWNQPMSLLGSVVSSGLVLTVRGAERGRYLDGLGHRQHVALWHRTAGWIFRQVQSVAMSGTDDAITLTTTLGTLTNPADVLGLYWLARVRLAADAVEVQWFTTDIARASITSEEVPA